LSPDSTGAMGKNRTPQWLVLHRPRRLGVAVLLAAALESMRRKRLPHAMPPPPCAPPQLGSAMPPSTAFQEPPIPFNTPDAFLEEAMAHFKRLLQFDTSNPPGQEEACADWCREQLEKVGIQVRVMDVESPGQGSKRRSIVARLPGPDSVPESEDLLLSAHLDVVPADTAEWIYPPFEATTARDSTGIECVWGRGAVDMKHMAAYCLTTMLELARTKAKLKRGLKLALVADEEAGCGYGALPLARQHPDWLTAKACITEAGGSTQHTAGKRLYPIQVGEKGFVWLKVKVKGIPGHGSSPTKHHALARLAPVLQDLIDEPYMGHKCNKFTKDCVDSLGDTLGGMGGWLFKSISGATSSKIVLGFVMPAPIAGFMASMVHNTAAPTMLQSGSKVNILPSSAELVVDCRVTPGTDPQEFIEEFKKRVGGACEVEPLLHGIGPPVENAYKGNPIYDLCNTIVHEADPGSLTAPCVIQGFTDARAYNEIGIPTYGFSPVWLPPCLPFMMLGFHGHNERIPVHGFRWGAACMRELVHRWCVDGHTQ